MLPRFLRSRFNGSLIFVGLLLFLASGGATWALGFPCQEVEPNNTLGAATALSGASAVCEGNVFPNADVDYFSFTATAGDRIYAAVMTSFSASASVDSTMTLRDGIDTILETDLDDGSFGVTSSTISGFTIPSTGTYFLRVQHALATAQLRPYRIFFQRRTGAPTAETELNDTFPGQVAPAGGWISGTTSATTDLDFFSVTLNAGDTVFLSLDLDPERDTTEWNGQLGFGAFGTPPLILVVNDAGTATPDSEAFFMTVHAAGTYSAFVGVPTGGATIGTYHLSITVFPAVDKGVNCTTYTSTNVPVAIPTGPAIVTSTITVPGNPRIADMDVTIDLTHNFMADLDVDLTSPTGNNVGLFSDVGSVTAGAQTSMLTTLNDEAGIPIGQFTVVQGEDFTPELNYRISWFDGQPAGGTWTLTLRDDAAADGGTLNNWSIRICEPPPPPTCPVGSNPVTVYSSDFEANDGGFTHSGAQDEWERGNPTFAPVTGCNSGTNCWKTDLDNTYNASSSQDLVSTLGDIDLTGLSGPVVINWAQKYQMESATFDHMRVEVVSPSRTLFQWLGATMTNTVGNPGVTVQEAAGWGQFSVRDDSLANQNIQLRFHVDSDTTVQLAGLAIDDVSVTACLVGASADLAITKTDNVSTAMAGGSVTYIITASNVSGSAVVDATVADTFPAGLTCTWTCLGAGGGTCTAAGAGNINDATVDLPVGASVTYTATCAVSASSCSGTLVNTATVTPPAGTTDPTPANNTATDTDTLAGQSDLSITKTDGVTSATAGGSVTYTIVASNAGSCPVTGATVADTFPADLTCSWTCAGAGGSSCTAAGAGSINDAAVNLPSGTSVTYTAMCTIAASACGSISNTATITAPAATPDPNPANNSATDTDTVPGTADLQITKTNNATSLTPGGTVTYTIVASNAGPCPVTGATVSDPVPTGLINCSWTCTGTGGATCTAAGAGGISDNMVNLPVDMPVGTIFVTYTLTCTVEPGATGTVTNTATITPPPGVTDPVPPNGTATDPDPIVGGPEAIPALSPLGLLALAVVLAGLALVMLKRRQRTDQA